MQRSPKFCDRLCCLGGLILLVLQIPRASLMRLRAYTLRGCEYAVLIVSGGGNRPGVCSWMERPGALSDGTANTRERGSALMITDMKINNNTACLPGAYIPLNCHHA